MARYLSIVATALLGTCTAFCAQAADAVDDLLSTLQVRAIYTPGITEALTSLASVVPKDKHDCVANFAGADWMMKKIKGQVAPHAPSSHDLSIINGFLSNDPNGIKVVKQWESMGDVINKRSSGSPEDASLSGSEKQQIKNFMDSAAGLEFQRFRSLLSKAIAEATLEVGGEMARRCGPFPSERTS